MTDAIVIGGDLHATDEPRVLAGRLLPYGVVGTTNLGKFSVDQGIFTIPSDISHLIVNEDHSQMDPRGRFESLVDSPEGLDATFRIAATPEGDALLARVEERRAAGKPLGLSAEVKGVVIRAGKAVKGLLTGVAFVDVGAFPGAALLASAVDTKADTIITYIGGKQFALTPVEGVEGQFTSEPVLDAEGKQIELPLESATVEPSTEAAPAAQAIATPEAPAPDGTDNEEGSPVGAATAPNTLQATQTTVESSEPGKAEIFGILHAIRSGRATEDQIERLRVHSGPAEHNLFAALTDIKISGASQVGTPIVQPQWIGELWSGVAYVQKYVPLFGHADLTGLVINAFRWTTKPAGGTWSGNKADVPSNTPVTAAYTKTASRFAGGHDIAREFKDFNVEGFFESYYAAMAESYAKWVDALVITDVLAAATVSEADNPGTEISAGMSALIDGAALVIAADAVPSFALMAVGIWKTMLKTPKDAALAYLEASLGLKDGSLNGEFKIVPSADLTAGNTLVGAKEAATVYELPGVPIRVEAPDMIKGGIDTGVFGYAGVVIHKATALQLVTPYTP